MTNSDGSGLGFVIIIGAALISLVVPITVIAIVLHFVCKFW